MNEAISVCRFLKVEGSYTWGCYCIMNEAISVCRFLKVEGSNAGFYCILNEAISVCRFLKVEGSNAGFYCIVNEAISVCRFLKVEGSYMWCMHHLTIQYHSVCYCYCRIFAEIFLQGFLWFK